MSQIVRMASWTPTSVYLLVVQVSVILRKNPQMASWQDVCMEVESGLLSWIPASLSSPGSFVHVPTLLRISGLGDRALADLIKLP